MAARAEIRPAHHIGESQTGEAHAALAYFGHLAHTDSSLRARLGVGSACGSPPPALLPCASASCDVREAGDTALGPVSCRAERTPFNASRDAQVEIHRATITQSDLHYVGSLTIAADLMEAAGLLPTEKVDVVNISNGARLSTYMIEGPRRCPRSLCRAGRPSPAENSSLLCSPGRCSPGRCSPGRCATA